MSEEQERDAGVKVVDRRRLDEDGDERSASAEPEQERRPDAGAAAEREPAAASEPPSASEPAAESETPSERASDHDAGAGAPFPIDFTAFVQSLAQQALMHMGVLPHPESGERVREMGLARQTIDILQMLHEKTQGNLSADEQRLYDALLHDLRLAFVQVNQ